MEVNLKEIKKMVELTNNAVAKKTVNPILAGVRLKADKNVLHIYATDLQQAFHGRIVTDVLLTDNFDVIVGQRTLLDLLSNLTADTVKLTAKKTLNLTAGTSEFNLPTFDITEFPKINFDIIANYHIQLDKNQTVSMLNKVMFCAAKQGSFNINLNSVLWEFKNKKMNLVTTDSYRLAMATCDIENDIDTSFLLSLKSVDELKNVLSTCATKTIQIAITVSQVFFEFPDDNIEIIFNTVDATFPEYTSVIPKKYQKVLTVNTLDFLGMVKRLAIACGKETSALFTIDDTLIGYASSVEAGEAREQLPIQQQGETIEIAYSPTFLRETLEKIETEQVILKIAGDTAPTLISPEDNSYFYVIMPQLK